MICGDFNEELPAAAFEGMGFRTLARDTAGGEPPVSRPAHKQQPSQNSSGKGKVDFILVAGEHAVIQRDDKSRAALLTSHCSCEETGEWPSDHGMEALTINLLKSVGLGMNKQ